MALVGAGEFLPAMEAVDRALLAATGRSRPRVVILPTASWPDGEQVFARWAAMGEEHFARLGAEVETAAVRDRVAADDPACAQAIGEADLVYLSGGKPDHLARALVGTAAGAAICAAHERGAVVAGSSAGAMILAGRHVLLGRRSAFPVLLRWRDALGLVPGTAVIPHYDSFPEPLSALVALRSPREVVVLGIDGGTVAILHGEGWQVLGSGRVTVWRGRRRERVRAGETFRL